MTPKQERFVQEYLIDLNATQAAIRCGYKARSAYSIGEENLRKPEIADAIKKAMEARVERTQITQDMIVAEYAKLGFANAGDYFEWGPGGVKLIPKKDLTREQMAAVSEVSETRAEQGGTIKIKLHDKKGALDSLAKHLGMFVERSEVSVEHHVKVDV